MSSEAAQRRFPNGWQEHNEYIRLVPDPGR